LSGCYCRPRASRCRSPPRHPFDARSGFRRRAQPREGGRSDPGTMPRAPLETSFRYTEVLTAVRTGPHPQSAKPRSLARSHSPFGLVGARHRVGDKALENTGPVREPDRIATREPTTQRKAVPATRTRPSSVVARGSQTSSARRSRPSRSTCLPGMRKRSATRSRTPGCALTRFMFISSRALSPVPGPGGRVLAAQLDTAVACTADNLRPVAKLATRPAGR
jgi:hypothetical protein